MEKIWVKLKDATKIAWDREQEITIIGSDAVEVVKTKFIADKIKEGVLVEVDAPEVKPFKPETPAQKKARLKAEEDQKEKDEAYEQLKATISEKIGNYSMLANGDLSTQEAINVAMAAKEEINLEGLNDADKADLPEIQSAIDELDAKVLEAQKVLDDEAGKE